MSDKGNELNATKLYVHVKEIAKIKYESELRREDSIIQQSSHIANSVCIYDSSIICSGFNCLSEYRCSHFWFFTYCFFFNNGLLVIESGVCFSGSKKKKNQGYPRYKNN